MNRYYVNVISYSNSILNKYITNKVLKNIIVFTIVVLVFVIRNFSRFYAKLVYYAVISIISYFIWSQGIFSSTPILVMIVYSILIAIPLTGELLIVLIIISGIDDKQPRIGMLIRGIRLSTKLASCGFPVFIGRNVRIYQPNNVSLGDDVTIYDNVFISAYKGKVVIGSHSHIDANSVIRGNGGVYIGNYVAIASGVKIYSVSNQAKERNVKIIEQPVILAPVIIEDDVWIGTNAVILPGAKIRQGAVVGAGAVVTSGKVLESYTIYVGIPARPLKKRGE